MLALVLSKLALNVGAPALKAARAPAATMGAGAVIGADILNNREKSSFSGCTVVTGMAGVVVPTSKPASTVAAPAAITEAEVLDCQTRALSYSYS